MRTISVKEAAQALGLSNRAIIYRLERGDLKGHQSPNPYGVNEWRIYPNKEIAQKLRLGNDFASAETDFAPLYDEAIDAETVSEEKSAEKAPKSSWVETERQQMRMIAEEMIKPLLETIRQQERQLEDQNRQLKLLPDLQKRAQEEHAAAELKELEAIALKKHLEALKEKQDEVEQAKQQQVEALEAALQEKQKEADLEIQRINEEKDAQIKAVEEQLKALTATVEELKQPWWKKAFR